MLSQYEDFDAYYSRSTRNGVLILAQLLELGIGHDMPLRRVDA